MNYQNNFVRTLKIMNIAVKIYDVLTNIFSNKYVTDMFYIVILIVQQNYFFDLYSAKRSFTTKLFFPCEYLFEFALSDLHLRIFEPPVVHIRFASSPIITENTFTAGKRYHRFVSPSKEGCRSLVHAELAHIEGSKLYPAALQCQ